MTNNRLAATTASYLRRWFLPYENGKDFSWRHRILLVAVAAGLATACLVPVAPGRAAPPSFLVGRFTDDYGNTYDISRTTWRQLPHGRFDVVRWNVGEQYVIARNAASNASAPGLWTRIDWMQLEMPPYTWAMCYSAYEATSAASAESTRVANRATPRTGCNGHPFSRMRRDTAGQ